MKKILHEISTSNEKIMTIFDVGANIGQSINKFLFYFPNSLIYAFEPSPSTYANLALKYQSQDNLNIYNIALSSENRKVRIMNSENSTANRISVLENNTVVVDAVTGDNFVLEKSIDSIDYLKIDTEGHDYNVLLGFINLLKNKKIKYVQVECSLCYDNKYHTYIEQFNSFFYNLGYGIYLIDEQIPRLGRKKYSTKKYCVVCYTLFRNIE